MFLNMSFTGNVTLVLGKNLASSLGRKGTVSDVSLYNNKTGDTVLSFVEPSSYPEKIQSLVSALNMADQALLKVEALTPELAESIVALDAAGMEKGFLLFGEDVDPDRFRDLASGTVVEHYPLVEEQVLSLREKLSEFKPPSEGSPIVQIDHCFTVKGVGTVALGVVRQGAVKKYDELEIYPSGGKTNVKSIQVHDVDVPEACSGSRVGLCLKNVKPEECPRGSLLSTHEVAVSDGLETTAYVSKYAAKGLAEGDVFLVNSCLNYVPSKVVSGSVEPGAHGKVSLEFEKKIPFFGSRILFLDPGRKAPRLFGFASI